MSFASSEKAPTILSVETSTAAGSVAVLFSADEPDEKLLALSEWRRGRSHAEVTTPAIEDAVRIARGWPKIEALAVDVGPGSFTGIRVGLNAVKTIGWSLGLPVISVRSTDALIEGVRLSGLSPKGNVIAAVLNAQMGLFFSAWDLGNNTATKPEALDKKSLAENLLRLKRPITLVGEMAEELAPQLQDLGLVVQRPTEHPLDSPNAVTVARLAARNLKAAKVNHSAEALVRLFEWRNVQPLYLRGSGAEEKMG